MSSKKLRALRNRQDRYKNQNILKHEVTEPYMETKNETLSEMEKTPNEESLGQNLNDVVEPSQEANEQVAASADEVVHNINTNEDEQDVLKSSDFGMIEDPDAVPERTSLAEDDVPRRAGAILKHAREKLGLSLNTVSHKLNLRVNSVADIEYDRLNQLTAVPFVSSHIENYAKLLNLDPNYLVNLYKETVRLSAIEKSKEVAARNKSAKTESWKKFVAIILSVAALIMAVSVAYIAFSGSAPKSAGALVIEDTVTPEIEKNGALVMDTENSKLKTNIVELPENNVDLNTQIAKEQDKTLNSNELIKRKNQPQLSENTGNEVVALTVKNAPVQEDDAPLQYEEDANSLVSVDIDTGSTSVKQSNKSVSNDKKVETVSIKAKDTKKADNTAVPEVKATADEKVKEVREVKVELSSSTRDISSSVRLATKRDPLAGVNSVTVKVSGNVAMKITGNGKTLKQGNYKAGDTVVAAGLIPLRIYVSDSSKISVKYVGAKVSVPSAKHVNFELPKQ